VRGARTLAGSGIEGPQRTSARLMSPACSPCRVMCCAVLQLLQALHAGRQPTANGYMYYRLRLASRAWNMGSLAASHDLEDGRRGSEEPEGRRACVCRPVEPRCLAGPAGLVLGFNPPSAEDEAPPSAGSCSDRGSETHEGRGLRARARAGDDKGKIDAGGEVSDDKDVKEDGAEMVHQREHSLIRAGCERVAVLSPITFAAVLLLSWVRSPLG